MASSHLPSMATTLESLVNHLTLPPRLPTRQDASIVQVEHLMITYVIEATNVVDFDGKLDCLRRSLDASKIVNALHRLQQASLVKAFAELMKGEFLVLHVVEQNAAVLIRRDHKDQKENVLFEAFEASPLSEDVLAAHAALQWEFPGCSVAIPIATYESTCFQAELATFLEKASSESIKRFAAHTTKAGSFAYESRESVNPALVTQLLMTLLEVNGKRIIPEILKKRVRDDVCWDQAENPWRRAPFWLVLRVSIQRHLYAMSDGAETGRFRYKLIVCSMLAQVLTDSLSHLRAEVLFHVRAKICRRLAKLETAKQKATNRTAYDHIFSILHPLFRNSIAKATERLDMDWATFRESNKRPVLPLPRRADPRHMNLSLFNCESHILEALSPPNSHFLKKSWTKSQLNYDVANAVSKPSVAFAKRYFLIAEMEAACQYKTSNSEWSTIQEIGTEIKGYINIALPAYASMPEHNSILILTVMELWVAMDKIAVSLYPLLSEYGICFPATVLDLLQLPRKIDIVRAHDIRIYLQRRRTRSRNSTRTIFDDPGEGCFADRYYEESAESPQLRVLHKHIEDVAGLARQRKEHEWKNKCADYEKLIRKIAETACFWATDEFGERTHDSRQCKKCFLQREERRFRIEIFEHPLPEDCIQAKAVVFELGCAKSSLLEYRDTTWTVLWSVAIHTPVIGKQPHILLQEYSELRNYSRSINSRICLASERKSFLQTHYANPRFPVGLDNVCLPNGLKKFCYFDPELKIWPGGQSRASFSHHCQLVLPPKSPFACLNLLADSAADKSSSYSVIASQSKCPSGLNSHEFMAFQALLLGKSRRWPQILVELGSTNVNFSTETSANLMAFLALQLGPTQNNGFLGSMHIIFEDKVFCARLLDLLDQRLESVSSNYRETYSMETIIMLLLRTSSIGEPCSRIASARMLEKARSATLKWTKVLRSEIQTASDAETSQRLSQYAFWAALLCRRTFETHVGSDERLSDRAVQDYVESSISFQDNLVGRPDELPAFLKNALVRDMKMVYRMRFLLRKSMQENSQSFLSSLNMIWPVSENSATGIFSNFEFLEQPHSFWVKVTLDSTTTRTEQVIHFDILEGHLLVMGKPIGKLPVEYQTSVELQELFGNQNLLTYPSNVPGMAYVLGFRPNGHQVHLGFRNGKLIIRALVGNSVLEYLPPSIFGNLDNFDLPAPLVRGCVHWLNLQSQRIDVRPKSALWISRSNNWTVDFRARRATRRNSTLLDPKSLLFTRVARIFSCFEPRQFLTVFQPLYGPLSVELKRLELTFFVNLRGLLESSQLQAEIIENQDAGTWYGLNSKIVMREVIQRRDFHTQRVRYSDSGHQKSIIVPIGDIKYKIWGPHVSIFIESVGDYGKYIINDVLNRLDCLAEPRLLYFKARIHAYTSFVLPDPLTGRTGTEEALHCLDSGHSQPWTPIASSPRHELEIIKELTPAREYYPSHLKVMMKTCWDENLTTSIQHDGFRPVVDVILAKSDQLSKFSGQSQLLLPRKCGNQHLTSRSGFRRQTHQRQSGRLCTALGVSDLEYVSRDRCSDSQGRTNILDCVSLIRDWPSRIHTTSDLAGILSGWANIGGYASDFNKILLSDLLDVRFDDQWGPLVNFCRNSSAEDKYRLMFLFATISFRPDIDMTIVRTLISFTVLSDLKKLSLPLWSNYVHFRSNQVPRLEYLIQLMQISFLPRIGEQRPSGINLAPKLRKKFDALERAHFFQQEHDSNALGVFLLNQWPCNEPTMDGFPMVVSIDVSVALTIILPEWRRMFQNFELSKHVAQVQVTLDQHYTTEINVIVTPALSMPEPVFSEQSEMEGLPTLQSFLSSSTFTSSSNLSNQPMTSLFRDIIPTQAGDTTRMSNLVHNQMAHQPKTPSQPQEHVDLAKIIDNLATASSAVHRQYAQDLRQSLNTLRQSDASAVHANWEIDASRLVLAIMAARKEAQRRLQDIQQTFEKSDPRAFWLRAGLLWPIITPVTLLETLRTVAQHEFGQGIREAIIAYALSITALQRLLRIESAYRRSNVQRLKEEKRNVGHTNWNPHDRPDWLLFEIDANMLIRAIQVDVALATISPQSEENSVLQMSMGEGKTSCIIPMVSAVLANGSNLHRVIIPKSLLLQAAQILQARLGGLVGREIRHVAFSRKTPTNAETIKAFYNIHNEMRKAKGVMLTLPEHILSFKLSGLQRLCDGRVDEAQRMIKVHEWLCIKSRDVIDECDSILAVRTQLIYPSGTQRSLDGHPHRWEIIEIVLRHVDSHLWNLQKAYPHSLEVVRRPRGGFPVIFFLRKDVEDILIERLIEDIIRLRICVLPSDIGTSDLLAIKDFISKPIVSAKPSQAMQLIYPQNVAITQTIHLLRGLFVHRILLMTLKKRWNVQYGLHPSRDPIAVPYLAKGIPSEQAEWGHPDVGLLFTCLAFYYDGLTAAQLAECLRDVLKADDPSQIYDRFTAQSAELPDSLRNWNAINLDDEAQLHEILYYVRYNMDAIDYYLNNFVFPKHAKQFQLKLNASGWDIPLASCNFQKSQKPLSTGFSGTNDWKRLLPLPISQKDLPSLAHTNAEVLSYLLQPRNRKCIIASDRGRRLSEIDLLWKIKSLGIRVLIDAGAQILEMTNKNLVKAWLELCHELPAAVYFNEADRAFVLYRNGREVPLLASPFAEDLSGCLVYLDEAHTRGTDLKFPADAVGALTLGLGQTKDHTVQAAMRLRQLGTTQSVVFFVPPEVQQSIFNTTAREENGFAITSYDVVCWLLEQTCSGIEQLQPLYYSQGVDYCKRVQAAKDNSEFLVDVKKRETYVESLQQVEQQTLEQLYGANMKKKLALTRKYSPEVMTLINELNTRRRGFQDTGSAVNGSALQEVEQEREVAYEVEAVRQVQKPVHFEPFKFPGLHRDIIFFAETGRFAADSTIYIEAFTALAASTNLGRKHFRQKKNTSGKLYVTLEFTRTISTPRTNDQYQRPVNWILWSNITNVALIVIPEEAEILIPLLRNAEHSPTTLLTYSAPVTRKMLNFGTFTFYSIPKLPDDWKAPMWFRIELGILAGRLYFEYGEYDALLQYIGAKMVSGKDEDESVEESLDESLVYDDNMSDESDSKASESVPDGVTDKHDGTKSNAIQQQQLEPFAQKPLVFLKEWIALRRKGQDFSQTPMGFICQGQSISESHPFFAQPQNNVANRAVHVNASRRVESTDDVEGDQADFDENMFGMHIAPDEKDTFDDAQLDEDRFEDETSNGNPSNAG